MPARRSGNSRPWQIFRTYLAGVSSVAAISDVLSSVFLKRDLISRAFDPVRIAITVSMALEP
jgi:hypothetical protein